MIVRKYCLKHNKVTAHPSALDRPWSQLDLMILPFLSSKSTSDFPQIHLQMHPVHRFILFKFMNYEELSLTVGPSLMCDLENLQKAYAHSSNTRVCSYVVINTTFWTNQLKYGDFLHTLMISHVATDSSVK